MSARLPVPIGRQKEVLCLPASGHTVVLGTAGSGKTTLAIHRAFYLANPKTDHSGRTLLLTFNRCLVAYLKSLAGAVPGNLEVVNYHRFARGYLNSRGRMRPNCICNPEQQKEFCQRAVEEARARGITNTVLGRPVEFLVDEFRWMAHHGITTAADYLAAERVGRSTARITRADRRVVFSVYDRYREIRSSDGMEYDWDDLAQTVHGELRADKGARRFRHVVIDEGQDFSPMMLQSLAEAIPGDGSLTFFIDMAQQIYGKRMSWRSAGLRIREPWKFEDNYRNTRQIAQLALAIAAMPHFPDDPDLVEPRAPTADGPLPALVSFPNEPDEIRFVAELATRRAQTETVAVLFRDRRQENTLRQLLRIPSTRLHRDLGRWPSGPGLYVGTYHSAKGLEFDSVLLPFLCETRLPHPPDIAVFGDEEAAASDSRLVYVAVTRARSTLVLTHTGQRTTLLPDDMTLYNRVER